MPALLAVAAQDIELYAPGTAALARSGRCYRGHDGIMRYMRDVARVWDELELIPHAYREAGDHHVIVQGRLRARGRGGFIVDEQADWLIDVRDGRIAWSRPYGDAVTELAELESAGMLPGEAVTPVPV